MSDARMRKIAATVRQSRAAPLSARSLSREPPTSVGRAHRRLAPKQSLELESFQKDWIRRVRKVLPDSRAACVALITSPERISFRGSYNRLSRYLPPLHSPNTLLFRASCSHAIPLKKSKKRAVT